MDTALGWWPLLCWYHCVLLHPPLLVVWSLSTGATLILGALTSRYSSLLTLHRHPMTRNVPTLYRYFWLPQTERYSLINGEYYVFSAQVWNQFGSSDFSECSDFIKSATETAETWQPSESINSSNKLIFVTACWVKVELRHSMHGHWGTSCWVEINELRHNTKHCSSIVCTLVINLQARNHYNDSLPLVPTDKTSLRERGLLYSLKMWATKHIPTKTYKFLRK